MRFICYQIFILICEAMLELLPFFFNIYVITFLKKFLWNYGTDFNDKMKIEKIVLKYKHDEFLSKKNIAALTK